MVLLVILRLLGERRPRDQDQHHQRRANFDVTHVNPLQPDYLYRVPKPDELIQIKSNDDLSQVN
jgi:hypothetical protein